MREVLDDKGDVVAVGDRAVNTRTGDAVDPKTGATKEREKTVRDRKDRARIQSEIFKQNLSDPGNFPNNLHPVYAVRSGVVQLNGYTDSGNFRIGINTLDGLRDGYIHLIGDEGYSLPNDASVEDGDIIGFVNEDDGHVHLERLDDVSGNTVFPGCESPLLNGKEPSGWYMDTEPSPPYPPSGHRGIDFPT